MSERGSLPYGWLREPLGKLGSFTNGINKSAADFGFGVPFINLLDVFGKTSISGYPEGLVNATQSEIERYSLRAGDVIFIRSSVKPSGVGLTALVERSLVNTVYSGFLIRFRPEPNRFEIAFLRHCFHSEEFRRELVSRSTVSANTNINQVSLRQIETILPSIREQRYIAEILSTMDELIEQTEALIAKMQQVKTGLMHDLFTRGVTPDGHLRPTCEQAPEFYKKSPLGWIPMEWEVKPLGALAEIVSGVTLGSKSENSDGIGVPYLRVANVQDGYLDLTEIKAVRVSQSQFEKLQLRYGDVLMNEGGDFDKLGRGSVWQEEIKPCIHQNHVFRVRPRNSQMRSFYLAFWSQSEKGKKYFVQSSKQSTNLASINSTQLNRFPIALPSSDEQERIEKKMFAHNEHADSLGQELAKLRQQKHGLMHDLLTGLVRAH